MTAGMKWLASVIITNINTPPSPVSYTHLDVYKRQALIKLPQKIDSYCILAVKKEKAEDFLIQNLIALLKKLFID